MKKALSLILALVMALSLSVTAFAAENDKSGSTTITATKAEPELAYTIVIPTATTLNDEAHENVQLGGDNGVAGITVTTHNSKTNVYYTVDLTNATLTDGTNTITTSYAYAQGGEYAELTGETKVTVYENKTVKASTIQVTADNDAWQDVPAGEYNATIVFNFEAEEAGEAVCEVNLEEYNRLFKVILIDDSNVYFKVFNHKSGSFVYENETTTIGKGYFHDMVYTGEYAVGDYFHVEGEDCFVKCSAPEAHGIQLDSNEVCFTYTNEDLITLACLVPVGSTFTVANDNYMVINTSSFEFSWNPPYSLEYNGSPLNVGDEKTINDGDAFVLVTNE